MNHAPIDPKRFQELADNVCDIKEALVGNAEFGRKGLVQEIEELKAWRANVTIRVATITGLITGAGFVVRFLVTGKF